MGRLVRLVREGSALEVLSPAQIEAVATCFMRGEALELLEVRLSADSDLQSEVPRLLRMLAVEDQIEANDVLDLAALGIPLAELEAHLRSPADESNSIWQVLHRVAMQQLDLHTVWVRTTAEGLRVHRLE